MMTRCRSAGTITGTDAKESVKLLRFLGDSCAVLMSFPDDIRKTAGQQFRRLQKREMLRIKSEYKPFPDAGPGVCELIVDNQDGWYRFFYVTKFEDAIYVLHAFQKKSNATPKSEIDIAKKRYGVLAQEQLFARRKR